MCEPELSPFSLSLPALRASVLQPAGRRARQTADLGAQEQEQEQVQRQREGQQAQQRNQGR